MGRVKPTPDGVSALTGSTKTIRENPLDHYRRVWRLAWPIILSNLSVPLVGAVDTAVVGHLPEPRYIGAVALGALIFSFLFWGFGFLRMGTTGFVAQAYGRGDGSEMAATSVRALLLAAVLGTLVITLQRPVGYVAFWALEGGPELEALAAEYFRIRVWSAPATLANYAILGSLIGLQRTGIALGLQLLLNGSNVALDLLLVVGFGLDVDGVAYASVCSDWTAALVGGFVLLRLLRPGMAGLDSKRLLDAARLAALLRVNANIMARTICLVLALFYFTAQGTRLGDEGNVARERHLVAETGIEFQTGIDKPDTVGADHPHAIFAAYFQDFNRQSFPFFSRFFKSGSDDE